MLGLKQERFSLAYAKLIIYAYKKGYKIRLKHLLRCQDCKVGKENSVHKDSLAGDLVLSINGVIVEEDGPYNLLHNYWDKLGGAKRIVGDLGHFSFEHRGMW